jgi:hypothetical protein
MITGIKKGMLMNMTKKVCVDKFYTGINKKSSEELIFPTLLQLPSFENRGHKLK